MINLSGVRSAPRLWVTVFTVLAMVLAVVGIQATPKAHAAEVQPTSIDFSLTGPNGNEPTALEENIPYTFSFEFTVPDGTQPGDHFTVTLPETFAVVGNSAAELGGGTTATVADNVVTVSFGDGVAGLINVRGGFEIIGQYVHNSDEEADVDVSVRVGQESVYEAVLKGAGPPPAPPMAVNKWSGYSTAPTNVRTSEALKLQAPRYNYQWITPVEGQVFAHWFIELNNWQGDFEPGVIGQDIVVTDQISGMPAGFTPEVAAQTDGALTQAQLDEQLNGYYLKNFVSVAVRDEGSTVTYPEGNNLGQTAPYITFSGDGFEFRVSDYLASIGVTPSDSAQYAINYYTLVPAVDANVKNSASVTSDQSQAPGTDEGWYRTVGADGWLYGDQPLTSLEVTKEWEGWNASVDGPTPAVQFELLADGQPARDLDADFVEPLTLAAGQSVGTWTDLPTQSAANVPIVYTVSEVQVDGFTSTTSGSFTPDLSDIANIPSGRITVTNVRDSTGPSESSETSEPSESSEASSTSETSEPSEPSETSEPSSTSETSEPSEPSQPSQTSEPSETSATSVTEEPSETSEASSTSESSTSSETSEASETPIAPAGPSSGSSIPWILIPLIPLIPLLGSSASSGSSDAAPVVTPTVTPTMTPTATPTQVQPQPQQPGAPAQQTPVKGAPQQQAPQQRPQQQNQRQNQQQAQQQPKRSLADTGADMIAVVLIALAMVLIGGAILIVRRRTQ